MNYTRILFTIVLAGVAAPSYAMKKRETEVVWVLKENANSHAPRKETKAVYVLREDAHLLPYPSLYDANREWQTLFAKKVSNKEKLEVADDASAGIAASSSATKPAKSEMVVSYKEKLLKLQEYLEKEAEDCRGKLDLDTYCAYNTALADIALKSPDMPSLEKLKYLCGNRYYEEKKEIIISLIKSGLNPNHIACAGNTLIGSTILREDIDFAQFLLKAGIKPLQEDIKQAQKSSCNAIKTLFDHYSPDSNIQEHNGVFFKKNNFGDILPLWQDIPPTQLKNKLIEFVRFMRKMPGTACIIEVPHNQSYVLDILRQTPFILHHADNMKSEWIYKNESSIPAPYTAVIGAQVVITKDDSVLVIEEKTRQGLLGFPAGTAELEELPIETAIRELKEEINLAVSAQDLSLFAIIHRKRVNKFKANSVNHYYTADSRAVTNELLVDNKEVLRAFYAPLALIAEQQTIDGLQVSPAVAALAQHLLAGRPSSFVQTFLDYRQLSKPEEARVLNDTMMIEFFGK